MLASVFTLWHMLNNAWHVLAQMAVVDVDVEQWTAFKNACTVA
jgi:uncharacterized protein (DUF1778 family)